MVPSLQAGADLFGQGGIQSLPGSLDGSVFKDHPEDVRMRGG